MNRGDILEAFLREMGASCLWQFALQSCRIEGYMARGRIFIVQLYGDPSRPEVDGWDIFIPACELNNTGATLNNVRRYIETGKV